MWHWAIGLMACSENHDKREKRKGRTVRMRKCNLERKNKEIIVNPLSST